MKLKKLSASIFFTPKGAIIVFVAMIAIIMIVSKVKGRQVLRARALNARREAAYLRRNNALARASAQRESAYNRRNAARRVPLSTANSDWRRQWDQMSGSSRFSRDSLQGRKMGLHLHTA